MALVQMNFNSEYLKGNHEISIILPDRPWETSSKEFYASGKNIPFSGCCTEPLAITPTGCEKPISSCMPVKKI